ncbi:MULTISPECIES: hypothetical protein [Streptomyces]|uniref:hypothetical protein n=1 Tax=Streptomyces TaxID=1883 RepID=UPI003428345C|nr:hypothetical protein OG449_34885 [Streptomyces globisporus]
MPEPVRRRTRNTNSRSSRRPRIPAAAAGVHPISRASVAAARPRLVSTLPPHSRTRPDSRPSSTSNSSANLSVAAARPVRVPISPADVTRPSRCFHPGPITASISRFSVTYSFFSSLNGCPATSCASHSGTTLHASPSSWPNSPSAVSTDTTPDRRSPGTTAEAMYDTDAPIHRPSSEVRISTTPVSDGVRDTSTSTARRTASEAPSRPSAFSSAPTAPPSRARASRPSDSG